MTRRAAQLAGWTLFVGCALVYTAAGLRDGDVLLTAGSLMFLVACLFFVVPLLRGR